MPRTTSPTSELRYDGDLARGLRRARLAAGIGFKQAAELVGMNMSSIWRIEHGKVTPPLETLEALCKLYGANLNIGPDGRMLTWMGEGDADGDAAGTA